MHIEDIRKILILGAGSMGQEIALQCAINGYQAVMLDVSADVLRTARAAQEEILAKLVSEGRIAQRIADEARARVTTSLDPAEAAENVDLVSESVPERVKLKREVWQLLRGLCPERTLFTSNSSFIFPSQLAAATGRPDRFAGMHFHKHVWDSNVVDILPHPHTSPETIELLTTFAKRIGQIPIVAHDEKFGYLFNSLFEPLMLAALKLAENGVASVEDIDRSWMGVTKSEEGLFGLMDKIGLEVIRDVGNYRNFILSDPQVKRSIAYLQKLIDQGRLGIKSGRGFYSYPNPAYEQPGFLTQALPPNPQEQTTSESTGRVMQRFELRMVDAPVASSAPAMPTLRGAALVVGHSATATALCQRLRTLGGEVHQVPAGLTTAEVPGWLDSLWQACPTPHLFLITAGDDAVFTLDAPDPKRSVLQPFAVCQRWFELASDSQLLPQSTLVAATALGGDFGISGQGAAVEGGAVAGLLKAVGMECAHTGIAGPVVKVVDCASEEDPHFMAQMLCQELALAQAAPLPTTHEEAKIRGSEIEVGYLRQRRRLVRLAPVTLPAAEAIESIPAGSVWVVTGGGRGITAYLAGELGRVFGLQLHLLGTTELPTENYAALSPNQLQQLKTDVMKQAYAAGQKPNVAWARVARVIEIQQTLDKMQQAGVRAEYHCCDVSDRGALAEVIDRVRSQSGPIHGVLHGAGVEITRSFQRKEWDVVQATLRPKLDGTLALMDLTRGDPLRYFIACGSLSGRFGSALQEDYAMANELMSKLIQRFRSLRPECHSVAIHWPAWDEIGMAMRQESRLNLQRINHTFLSPAEGAACLMDELAAGVPIGEVVIVDPHELPMQIQCA